MRVKIDNKYNKLQEEVQKKRGKYVFAQKKAAKVNNAYYSLRSLLGYNWARFFLLLGGREAGKSWVVMDQCLRDYLNKGRQFIWMRLTEAETNKLLQNNGDKLIERQLRERYNLDIYTRTNEVYQVLKRDDKGKVLEKKLMARVLALSTFYTDKGQSMYDPEEIKKYGKNIVLDEMNREQSARRTFDITYAFVNQMENTLRSSKDNYRVFLIGNTLEEASDLLCCFEFIPDTFGRFKLRKKKAVIDYMPPSEKYLARRKDTVADLLTPELSTFSNMTTVDKTLICKKRLSKPNYVIKFDNDIKFTVWDGNIITQFNNEKVRVVPMKPYKDEIFTTEARDDIITMFDLRAFRFRNLLAQKEFKKQLQLLKPRG